MSKHVNHAFVQSARVRKGVDPFGRPSRLWINTGIRRVCRLRSALKVKVPLEVKWNTKGLAKCLRCIVALDELQVEIDALETLEVLEEW